MFGAEGVCKECKRENSIESNRIVFCDNCNSPYHQLCHYPPIDRIMVDVPDAQWFCHECQAKQTEQPLQTGLAGNELDPDVRRAYLSSLSQSQLVQLVQFAETLHPGMPLYSPQTYQLVKRLHLDHPDQPLRQRHLNANEDLLVEVISESPKGIEMADIWKAVDKKRKVPSDAAFKHAASRALQRARRRGRVSRDGEKYFINPDYQPSSDQALSQLLEADDEVMFGYMPLQMALDHDELPIEEGPVFGHRVYAH